MQTEATSSIYAFRSAYAAPEETARLDNLHSGLRNYFGGKLSFASLEHLNPTSILEIGSGSGAWSVSMRHVMAIQAAQQFPTAQVIAIDLSPIPARPLPRNVIFQNVDITQPFPFEEGSFDIVHSRLVLMHVPEGEDVLRRAIKLVKPGGWILIEDPDDNSMVDDGSSLGSGMSAFVQGWLRVMRSRGANPSFGRELERILKSTGELTEVNIQKVTIPISEHSGDEALNKLGHTWRETMIRIAQELPTRLAQQGFTSEVTRRHLEELQDPTRRITTDMYFAWCRKA
ncbi:S-adenosyl-L-methionine-dependent methyltransferase [Daedaleopsis nitida]|nr:S-adenosyl-L-methionine-dependent methyltransferase [Daedaleopsis nitida]